MWSGNYPAATHSPTRQSSAPQQLGSGHVDVIALSIRAPIHAHAGREADALADADAALAAAARATPPRMAEWPLMAKGFLEVSLGRLRRGP